MQSIAPMEKSRAATLFPKSLDDVEIARFKSAIVERGIGRAFGCSLEDIMEGWQVGINNSTRLHPMYAYLALSPKYTVNEKLGRWIIDDLGSLKGVSPTIFDVRDDDCPFPWAQDTVRSMAAQWMKDSGLDDSQIVGEKPKRLKDDARKMLMRSYEDMRSIWPDAFNNVRRMVTHVVWTDPGAVGPGDREDRANAVHRPDNGDA